MPAVLEKKAAGTEKALVRDPFTLMDRMRDEFDRLFEGFGITRHAPAWPTIPAFMTKAEAMWMPNLEVSEKDGNWVVKADLPGMKKEDVTVEVTPEGLTLKGERKTEFKEEKKEEGYFRTERTYGEFCRFVPLPEGAVTEKAAATFKDGVLEVVIPVPKLEKPAPKTLPIG
jgi:HSP20 family protein